MAIERGYEVSFFPPDTLDDPNTPELDGFPKGLLLEKLGVGSSGLMCASTIYEPDLRSLVVGEGGVSLTYPGPREGDWIVISQVGDRRWEASKYVQGKLICFVSEESCQEVSISLGILGITEGEGFILKRLDRLLQ